MMNLVTVLEIVLGVVIALALVAIVKSFFEKRQSGVSTPLDAAAVRRETFAKLPNNNRFAKLPNNNNKLNDFNKQFQKYRKVRGMRQWRALSAGRNAAGA